MLFDHIRIGHRASHRSLARVKSEPSCPFHLQGLVAPTVFEYGHIVNMAHCKHCANCDWDVSGNS